MGTTSKKIGVFAVAAVVMTVVAVGCSAQQEDGVVGVSGASASSAAAVQVASVSAGAAGVEVGGIEAGWLDASQRAGLEAALGGYFGAGARLRVVGGPVEAGQATVTYVEDLDGGGFYEARLYPGDKWAVGPLRQLVDGVNARGGDRPDDGLDATGELTSRGASFDAGNCVSATDQAALSELVGRQCSESLAGDLSAFLLGRGVVGVTERDIMVERNVARDGDDVRFKVLAVSGNDRIVAACSWSEADGVLSVEVLG